MGSGRSEGEGANLDLHFDLQHLSREINKVYLFNTSPSASPAEGRRPEGDGANLVRHLVPYHGKCKVNPILHRLYLFMYIYK